MSETRDLFVGATALHEGYAVPPENKEHLRRILRLLVFNVARASGSSVPDVRLGEPRSRVRQAP